MKTKLSINIIVSILAVLFLGNGCANLAPEGAYKGNQVLYRADGIIPMSYTLLHQFVTWEYTNREVLKDTPEIKQAADFVRLNAKNWITSAMLMREAYALNPTPENQTKLDTALNILSAALNEATKYLSMNAARTSTITPAK